MKLDGSSMIKKVGFILGPIIFFILHFSNQELISADADSVVGVAIWMIIWWITEAVSISITALIPLVIFPLFGIVDIKTVSASYGNHIIFLFFGGFVLALALEKVNLHRRIALNIIKLTGTSPDRIVLGFMIGTALLSMWISNTASTVVMLPIALSVIEILRRDVDGYSKKDRIFALSLMLGIAFSANIGGTATLIGTPPNIVMAGFLEEQYNIEISFFRWMIFGVPFALTLLAISYIVIVKWIYRSNLGTLSGAEEYIESELSDMGSLSMREFKVLIVFIFTVILWIFKSPIELVLPFISLSNSGISMLGAFTMFCITHDFSKGEMILQWEDTKRLPWGILILFGGGLALASALADVGIIDMVGETIASIDGVTVSIILVLLVSVMLFMTELMSNVALVAIFIPVVAGIAIGIDFDLLYLCIPVTVASSCAFMLPMATPPNAIVFASGYIKVFDMVKVGVILNVVSIILIILAASYLIPWVF